MFQHEPFDSVTPLAQVMHKLPVCILMALPDYVTRNPNAPIFDLTSAISRILHSTNWAGTRHIFQPHYWAPDWPDRRLAALPRPAHNEPPSPDIVGRIGDFPPVFTRTFAITHFTGLLASSTHLALGAGQVLSADKLTDALEALQTRLFILQVLPSESFQRAKDLAAMLVRRGIPAVLVVQTDNQADLNQFFLQMYFNLAHDLPLVDMVGYTDINSLNSVQAYLATCANAAEVLNLRAYRADMRTRLLSSLDTLRPLQDELRPMYDELTDRGRHTTEAVDDLFGQTDRGLSRATADVERALNDLERVPEHWHHESEGIVPLSQVEQQAQMAEAQVGDLIAQYHSLRRRAEDELLGGSGTSTRRSAARPAPSAPPRMADEPPQPRQRGGHAGAIPDSAPRAEAPPEPEDGWLGGDRDEPPLPAAPLPGEASEESLDTGYAEANNDDSWLDREDAPANDLFDELFSDEDEEAAADDMFDELFGEEDEETARHPAAAPLDDLRETIFHDDGGEEEMAAGEAEPEQPEERLLNASFAEADGADQPADTALTAGGAYDLLVDVGPRREDTLVTFTPQAFFPFKALDPELDGYLIDVVFVSDDFTPATVTTQMWVPRLSGTSRPIVDGKLQSPGPVALRLTAPAADPEAADGIRRAYGRLNLYYENNLLQSALVNAAVSAQPGAALAEDARLRVDVDFVLTATYAELQALKTRQVHFVAEGDPGEHPVRLSLMMNSNGNGGHRIVVKARQDGQGTRDLVGHTPYDPQAVGMILQNARDALFDCYFERDESGIVTDTQRDGPPAFNDKNGKSLAQFKRDLGTLAIQGSALFSLAFDHVKTEGSGLTSATWQRELLKTLRESAIIQITRVSSANYVFPWSLVYEYPLITAERNEWRVCQIVNEEWAQDGTRQQPAGETHKRCKYHDESWHKKNVICPYGFWGLKHIIEEPQSIQDSPTVADVGRRVYFADKLDLAVSITEDPALVNKIATHLGNMARLPDIRFVTPQPATGWKSLRPNLKAPEIVYFLCHGEADETNALDSAYLSIGARDDDPDHRIYAVGTLGAWIRDLVDGPDTDAWAHQRPLVFINGCHTNGLRPGHIVSFASAFASLGACGVLGTEVRVPVSVATEVAESFFSKIAPPQQMTVGDALRQLRWELANKGNVLGLAYSLYGLADLRVETDPAGP